ncbi:leucine-rich repeat and coiled-coil domain-containing protein PF07_0014-like isoform X3 [Rhinatrema bivittatum]|uniref:leucine-rich repeat and coiled-coil domain-containing protein PF07_0014-like isoform X3 n=1 Tax=Rhinatrema bivittatum TaxID=194408 RepID=UPI00112EE4C6|nr:leucine-rich repeat and coiled-coil domain-containing protein PF07_0014-like isoform X3 [Rhinatrema bivittatum]
MKITIAFLVVALVCFCQGATAAAITAAITAAVTENGEPNDSVTNASDDTSNTTQDDTSNTTQDDTSNTTQDDTSNTTQDDTSNTTQDYGLGGYEDEYDPDEGWDYGYENTVEGGDYLNPVEGYSY